MNIASDNVIPLTEYYWSASRYSEVLTLDRRMIGRALGSVAYTERSGVRLYHIRDAMPAIYKVVLGVVDGEGELDIGKLPPKARLDHYKAERERIKLGMETGLLLEAAKVEVAITQAFKSLATVLDTLPDILERDCGLTGDKVIRLQEIIDNSRESLYESLVIRFTTNAE
jgi:hypothetical protein